MRLDGPRTTTGSPPPPELLRVDRPWLVFLQGGRPTYGPKAAEIAGRMYRGLYDHSFFAAKPLLPNDAADVKSEIKPTEIKATNTPQ